MKRDCLILIVFVVGCALLLQIGCQQAPDVPKEPKTVAEPEPVTIPAPPPAEARPTEPQRPKRAPKITFEKEICDLGEIAPGTKNVCEFKFSNTGDALLKVTRAQACCGFSAKLKDNKKEYAPGESGAVIVTFSAKRFRGSLTKNQHVSSNDSARPRVKLTVKARIVQQVVYKPERLSLSLKDPNGGCPKITISSVDNQPFAIKSLESPENCITAAFDSSVKEAKFVLEPKVDIERLEKNLRGQIRIGLTHPKCSMVSIPFNVLPRFTVTPRAIAVRNAEPGKLIKKEVSILNNYNEDFEVESTSSKNGIIKVLSQQKVGNRCNFELEIMPPQEDDKRFFADVFYVNMKGGRQLEINCRGFYPRKATKPGRTMKGSSLQKAIEKQS